MLSLPASSLLRIQAANSFVSLFLCLMGWQCAAGSELKSKFANVDTYIEGEMARAQIPGVALAVVQGADTTHLRGFGIAGANNRPVTTQSPFLIGSTTKAFTALAVMQLVEDGAVDLDTPVQVYLPWFQVADAEAATLITVLHLLTHTSGISTAEGRKYFADDDTSAFAIERRVRALAGCELIGQPGNTFQYSNANYAVLAAVIEQVSGKRYGQYLKEHVFQPLEMDNIFTSYDQAQRHGLANGHRYWFGRPFAATDLPFPGRHLAGGYLMSSAEDMAHFLLAHLDGGRYQHARVISQAGMARLHKPLVEISPGNNYAMGWYTGNWEGREIISHGGVLPHFHADIVMVPNADLAVAVLINADSPIYGGPIGDLVWNVTRILLDEQPRPPSPRITYVGPLIGLTMIPLVQLVGIVYTVRLLRRWSQYKDTRPRTWLGMGWHIVLPIFVNGTLMVCLLLVLPKVFQTTLAGFLLFVPEVGWLAVCCSLVAGGWCVMRTTAALRLIVARRCG